MLLSVRITDTKSKKCRQYFSLNHFCHRSFSMKTKCDKIRDKILIYSSLLSHHKQRKQQYYKNANYCFDSP